MAWGKRHHARAQSRHMGDPRRHGRGPGLGAHGAALLLLPRLGRRSGAPAQGARRRVGRAARRPPGRPVPQRRRAARALARRAPRLAAGDVDRGALQRQGLAYGSTRGAPGIDAQARACARRDGGVELGGRLGGRRLGALPRAALGHRLGARRAGYRRQSALRDARAAAPRHAAPSQQRAGPPSARGRRRARCLRRVAGCEAPAQG